MTTSENAPRRFYKGADFIAEADGFVVRLDGRVLKTPAKAKFVAPTRALAAACAAEWDAQGERIRAETMPLTRLTNVALDWAARARSDLIAGVVKYSTTDRVSYRAAGPAPLAARESAAWDPLLDWAATALGVQFAKGVGVGPVSQPQASLDAIARAADALDDFALTGLAHGAGLSGSAIIPFALARGAIDARQAFQAAMLEELWQIETWGEDEEARRRLVNIEAEITALSAYFAALA